VCERERERERERKREKEKYKGGKAHGWRNTRVKGSEGEHTRH